MLTRLMHLCQQLALWKAIDLRGKPFLLKVANVLCIFLKHGLPISCM